MVYNPVVIYYNELDTYILEPHNRENDVGERSDLLDVSHLANREIYLHPRPCSHGRAHYWLHVDVKLMLFGIWWRYSCHGLSQGLIGCKKQHRASEQRSDREYDE